MGLQREPLNSVVSHWQRALSGIRRSLSYGTVRAPRRSSHSQASAKAAKFVSFLVNSQSDQLNLSWRAVTVFAAFLEVTSREPTHCGMVTFCDDGVTASSRYSCQDRLRPQTTHRRPPSGFVYALGQGLGAGTISSSSHSSRVLRLSFSPKSRAFPLCLSRFQMSRRHSPRQCQSQRRLWVRRMFQTLLFPRNTARHGPRSRLSGDCKR